MSCNTQGALRWLLIPLLFWLPPLQARDLLIDNVNVLTLQTASPDWRQDHAVLVREGVIVDMGPSGSLAVPAGAERIDGGGGTLMPGLIDAHVHVWDTPELAAFLSYGVTTVRNMSGMDYLLAYQRQIDAGELLGPRLLTTGPILNSPGPNAQVNHQLVNSVAEARAAVQWQHARGYRHLKVYSNLTREAYAAIRDEGQRLGMSLSGHPVEGRREAGMPATTPFNIAFAELLDDNFTTLEHMESIVWHGLRDRLDETVLAQLAQTVAGAGVSVTPTLLAHHSLVRAAREKTAFTTRRGTALMNPFLAAIEAPVVARWVAQPAGTREDYDAFYARGVKVFHEAGVRLVAGSDAGIFVNIPGESLLRELELLVGAGLSPHAALRSATADAAAVLGLADVGQVAPGYRAELLLLAGSPLQDLAYLEQPLGLLLPGGWHDAAALAALRSAAARGDTGRTEEQVMSALEAQQALAPPAPPAAPAR